MWIFFKYLLLVDSFIHFLSENKFCYGFCCFKFGKINWEGIFILMIIPCLLEKNVYSALVEFYKHQLVQVPWQCGWGLYPYWFLFTCFVSYWEKSGMSPTVTHLPLSPFTFAGMVACPPCYCLVLLSTLSVTLGKLWSENIKCKIPEINRGTTSHNFDYSVLLLVIGVHLNCA
jgi:hypothetical protein